MYPLVLIFHKERLILPKESARKSKFGHYHKNTSSCIDLYNVHLLAIAMTCTHLVFFSRVPLIYFGRSWRSPKFFLSFFLLKINSLMNNMFIDISLGKLTVKSLKNLTFRNIKQLLNELNLALPEQLYSCISLNEMKAMKI